MELFSVIEHQRIPITIEWFDPKNLPAYVKDYLDVMYDPTIGYWVIEARSYTGIIPLNSDYGIQILPKSGLRNLTYMLFRSGMLTRSLETPFDQTVPYKIPEDDLESFFEGLVQSFLKTLDQIKSWGLFRQIQRRDLDLFGIKGKIDYRAWLSQYSANWGLPIPQKIFTTALDNYANRVLRWCLEVLFYSPLTYINKSEILERIDYFGRIPIVPLSSDDISIIDYQIETGKFPASRYYYLPALNLALLILRGAGLSLGETKDVEFKPILINTYDMFERYIRILCQETANRYSAHAENGKVFTLPFYSGYGPNIYVKPDIVIRLGGSSIVVMDVKYKTYPTDQDHYQLSAYMQTYGVSLGGFISLVHPLASSKSEKIWYERNNSLVFNFPFDCVEIRLSEKTLDKHLISIFERIQP